MNRHLVQLNVATLRHPMDDPRIADFANALPVVNGAGEQSPGYVWRLQSDRGDATDIEVFEDPLMIVNLTVWESLESLKAFAYRGIHRDFFRRRAEWFVEGSTRTALWWVPAGELPTTDDAKRRLDFINVLGSSPFAFEMGQNQPAMVLERVGAEDHRAAKMIDDTCEPAPTGDLEGFVVVELDDVAVACGEYRTLDDRRADITQLYVAKSARGLRVGVAIIAELETLARADGRQRIALETSPKLVPTLENFGWRQSDSREAPVGSPRSVCMEKALGATQAV
ncbi:MAG: GNAT family N-acetyltransferase [Ilumatobacteraceae bacterium]